MKREESILLVDGTEFGLDKPLYNKIYTAKLIKKQARHKLIFTIRDPAGREYKLYESQDGTKGRLYLIDVASQRIGYLVSYVQRNVGYPIGKSALTQIKVWRSPSMYGTSGITKKVFYAILGKKSEILMSDSMQTEGGKNFWMLRVQECISYGSFIPYLYDRSKQKMTKITNFVQFNDMLDDIWGHQENPYRHRRLVLVKKGTVLPDVKGD